MLCSLFWAEDTDVSLLWLHEQFCYERWLWERRCWHREHCIQVLSSPELRGGCQEILKISLIQKHNSLCKVFYRRVYTLQCQWEESWKQVFPVFISRESEMCASEQKFRSRSRRSALRTEVTTYFLTPASLFGPWVQRGAMLRYASWETRSERINLLFRGKDRFLKIRCSILGLEREMINVCFCSRRLWHQTQGINRSNCHTSCRQKSPSNGS